MVASLDLVRGSVGVVQRDALRLRFRRGLPPGARFARVLFPVRLRSMPLPVPQLMAFGYLGIWSDRGAMEEFRAEALEPLRTRERLFLELRPLQSFGSWLGGDPLDGYRSDGDGGRVLLLTHSCTRPLGMLPFMRADRPVVRSLAAQPGQIWAGGFMDGVTTLDTGTLSLWRSEDDATRFAYGPGVHREAVAAQRRGGWFSQAWFGRFAVTGAAGRWRGLDLGEAGSD